MTDTPTLPDILARICADTLATVAIRRAKRDINALRDEIEAMEDTPRGFGQALKTRAAAGKPALIAEIKKASPSGGLIRPNFDPPALAQAYRAGEASCLSILTDEKYFQGSAEHLRLARAAVDLPVLRKDFMLDPWQVYEARAMGADCILLIMAALSDAQAREMEAIARGLDMNVLVEVHDLDELNRALGLETSLIGINNRNLKTLWTDLNVTEELAPHVPPDRLLIAESGIKNHADLTRLMNCGAQAFLVGESLMRQNDVTSATQALFDRFRMSGKLTHFDQAGNATIVDVSAKPATDRLATARARIVMAAETLAVVIAGSAKKGDVLGVARLAGIMGAKRTADLIPLCHPLPITAVTLDLTPNPADNAVEIEATVRTTGQTGVEMEALTAASIAALTVYDMLKAIDRGMRISDLRVTHKSGGKSGEFNQP